MNLSKILTLCADNATLASMLHSGQRNLWGSRDLSPATTGVILGVLLATYSFWVLSSHYFAGSFAFHDLTMISEFMSNTAYGRGFFWVNQYGLSHFKIHFSPTLILLTPLFRLFDSQMLLLFLNVFFLYLAFGLFILIQKELLALSFPKLKSALSPGLLHAVSLLFLLLMGLNRYTKNVQFAASCWFPSLTLSAALILALLRNSSWITILILSLLTLGVRQDVGLYLSLQCFSLYFLPGMSHPSRQEMRRKILIASAIAFSFTLILSVWILPKIGMASHTDRGWAHYGGSWSQVVVTMLTHPVRVATDVCHSAFLSLNTSLFWLTILNPFLFLWNNLSGVLFYICSDPAKKYLWYYNSGFLLPGMFLSAAFGMWKLLDWSSVSGTRFSGTQFRCGILFLYAIVPVSLMTLRDANTLKFVPVYKSALPIQREVLAVLRRCPEATRVAADFRTIAFVPNTHSRWLLDHYSQTDIIFFSESLPDEPGNFSSVAVVEKTLNEDHRFKRITNPSPLHIYRREEINCTDG